MKEKKGSTNQRRVGRSSFQKEHEKAKESTSSSRKSGLESVSSCKKKFSQEETQEVILDMLKAGGLEDDEPKEEEG